MGNNPLKRIATFTWFGFISYLFFGISSIIDKDWGELGIIIIGIFWLILANGWYIRYVKLNNGKEK